MLSYRIQETKLPTVYNIVEPSGSTDFDYFR